MNTIRFKYLVILLLSCVGIASSIFLLNQTSSSKENKNKVVVTNKESFPKEESSPKEVPEKKVKKLEVNTTDINLVTYYLSKSNPLSNTYEPLDLVEFSGNAIRPSLLRNEANRALIDLFEAADMVGHPLLLISGYRSYDYQLKLYNTYLKYNTSDQLEWIDDLPGKSEHQLGLAVDLGDAKQEYLLEKDFSKTETFKWLEKNSSKYGFILRYPMNKENITGYQFHPWHFRFVGKELAEKLSEKRITFDEFVGKK